MTVDDVIKGLDAIRSCKPSTIWCSKNCRECKHYRTQAEEVKILASAIEMLEAMKTSQERCWRGKE